MRSGSDGTSCAAPPASPTTFGYDALGQRSAKTPSAGAATSYAYDQAQRLTTVSGAVTASYAYNGDGLRTSKTVAGTTTAFSWDVARGLPLLLAENVGARRAGTCTGRVGCRWRRSPGARSATTTMTSSVAPGS